MNVIQTLAIVEGYRHGGGVFFSPRAASAVAFKKVFSGPTSVGRIVPRGQLFL